VPDIVFGTNGKAVFPTKYHGDVTLSKGKWDTICAEPERAYYRFNGEKVATTLINPDTIRHHRHEPNQFFYYKKFLNINLNGGLEMGSFWGVYYAVIIDESTGRICTVYPVLEPKAGKAFKPNEN
jgi:hypothetical protein